MMRTRLPRLIRMPRLIGFLVAGAALAWPLAAQAPTAGASLAPNPPASIAMGTAIDPIPAASTAMRTNPVTAARDATRKYHSFVTAKKNGYGLFHDANGIACIAKPGMGAMGIHFVNGALVGDGKVQLKKPEALVYARENGKRRLVALEYVVLKKDWEKMHGANAHRPHLYGQRFNLTHKGNRYGLPAFYSLHAWIWKKNPAGMFEMWNPNVHCSCCP